MTSSTNDGRGRQGRLRHEHLRFRSLLEGPATAASWLRKGASPSWCFPDPIVSELREKLTDKFGVPSAEVDAIVDRLSTHAERVPVQGRSGWVPQDPDDDKFIHAALSGGATIIVSGDHHLLVLGTVEGIEILTARQFLNRLATTSRGAPEDL